MARQAVRRAAAQAQLQEGVVELDVASTPVIVTADPGHLARIVDNGNALTTFSTGPGMGLPCTLRDPPTYRRTQADNEAACPTGAAQAAKREEKLAMRVSVRILMTAVGALGLLAASAIPSVADEGGNLTDFSSMTPVTGSAVGAINDRGIKGGGLPWVITSGTGTVSLQGEVDVTVTGLVIPVLGNRNPVPLFKATVSCLGPEGVVNVSTVTFPANPAGDAHIQAVIDLPRPCKHPIIFVAAPTGQWFAESNPDTQP